MGYLKFDKRQLVNLEYSLSREYLRTNQAGSFSNSTIINCNTRKYHGLLICPIEDFYDEHHILLSSLDETIIQHDREFHLAVHKYPGVFHPGHKYIREYNTEPIPSITYRVGGVVFKKELLLVEENEQILVKYTLLEAHSPTIIRLHPFLIFRHVHALSKANLDVKTKYYSIQNGIKTKMYDAYPFLNMQLSIDAEYISAPDWFYNAEYIEEVKRGYDAHEDLFVPGFFEFSMKKDDVVIFSGSLKEEKPKNFEKQFDAEIDKRIPRDNYENCLENAAIQFFIRKNNEVEIIAGFPWLNKSARDTFIALPGLTLSRNDPETCFDVLYTTRQYRSGALFHSIHKKRETIENIIDSSLWFIYAVMKYCHYINDDESVWNIFGEEIKDILYSFKNGGHNFYVADNGLIYAGSDYYAFTWMNAYIDDKPVTPRNGFAVEVNALWYNAVCFVFQLAESNNDTKFIQDWGSYKTQIADSFIDLFWDENKGYLADYANENHTDWAVRPNQIIATSLYYSPIDDTIKNNILQVVKNELVTPRGLRSLSPKNPKYIGIYEGDIYSRDNSYHNGTAWPWLLGHFVEAYLKLYELGGLSLVKNLYAGFEEEMYRHGIGTLSEIYDGNPPHLPNGAISYAPSVGELIRIKELINKYNN